MGGLVPGLRDTDGGELRRSRGLAPLGPFLWKRGTTLSVGNLAFGGRGKTPVVRALARYLLARGERPAILSRGYGRRRPLDGAVVVSDGRHLLADIDRAGDEPLMLARALPGAIVVVSDVRAVAAALAHYVLGASVLLLDDGFQHRAVARDVDIVLVTPDDLRDRRVPFGRLREPPSALARADAAVIDGRADDLPPMPPGVAVFSLARALGVPSPLEPGRPAPTPAAPVVALAGIAGPGRFERMLADAGWSVARVVTFPDHHRYRRRDLERLAAVVADAGASHVLTTEKDAVRLLPLRPLPVPIAAVPLEATVEPERAFHAWLDARLREARA